MDVVKRVSQGVVVGLVGGAYQPVKTYRQTQYSTLTKIAMGVILVFQVIWGAWFGSLLGLWAGFLGVEKRQVKQRIKKNRKSSAEMKRKGGFKLFDGIDDNELEARLVQVNTPVEEAKKSEDEDEEYEIGDVGFDELRKSHSLVGDHTAEWDRIADRFHDQDMEIQIEEIVEIFRYWSGQLETTRAANPDLEVLHVWYGAQSTETYCALDMIKEGNFELTVHTNPSHANSFAFVNNGRRELVLGVILVQADDQKASYQVEEFYPKYRVTYTVE